MMFSKVDFPHPDGPTKHTNCPSSMLRLTFLTAAIMPSGELSPAKCMESEENWEECAVVKAELEELPMTLKYLEMSLISSLAKIRSWHQKTPSNINSIYLSLSLPISLLQQHFLK